MGTAKLILTLTISQFLGTFAHACLDSALASEDVLDLSKFSTELEAAFSSGKCDLRKEVVIPTNENDPMWNLNAIGKVTRVGTGYGVPESDATFEARTRIEENKAFGTGTMISPCHMITNHHVVSQTENAMGKQVNFSYGSTGKDFKFRKTGTVIDAGAYLEGGIEKDWVIVKLDKPVLGKKVPFIIPDFRDPRKTGFYNTVNLFVGTPGSRSVNENQFKLYGAKAKATGSQFDMSAKVDMTPGNSGTLALALNPNYGLVASGINAKGSFDRNNHDVLGFEARPVTLHSIAKRMNPSVVRNIVSSIKNNSCE